MPQYRVKERGFFNGRIYDPNGKRPVLVTAEPLDKVPSWLEPILHGSEEAEKEAIAQIKADEEAAELEAAELEASLRLEVDAVTFVEGPSHVQGENVPGQASSVETLK